jgi:hypothetical protein
MPIELDHTIVPSHHKVASAKLLAELLGVPWSATIGKCSPSTMRGGQHSVGSSAMSPRKDRK